MKTKKTALATVIPAICLAAFPALASAQDAPTGRHIAHIERIVSCSAGGLTGEAELRGSADNLTTYASMQLVRYRILGSAPAERRNRANVYVGVDTMNRDSSTWWYGPWKEVTDDNGIQDGQWHSFNENDSASWASFNPYKVSIINGGVKFTFDTWGADPTCKTTDNGWSRTLTSEQ